MKKGLLAGTLLYSLLVHAQSFNNTIVIEQNGIEKPITTENSSLYLDKKPFTIRFENKFYNAKKDYLNALQVAIIANDKNLGQIEEGTPINLVPYFEVGTALAPDEDGFYGAAVVNSYGHHYLYYENDTNRSVALIATKQPLGIFRWEINRFYIDGTEYAIKHIKVHKLNFIFLNDFNANGIIDLDELRIVELYFN